MRVSDACILDIGVGVAEATGVSTLAEPSPSIRASTEARRRAIEALRAVMPRFPVSDGRTYADLAGDRLDSIMDAAEAAPIVAEWRLEDGRVAAVARLPLFEGEGALIPAALGTAPDATESAVRPALIVTVASGMPAFALLPELRGPEGEKCFGDPEVALARGDRPLRYARGRVTAQRMLADGQDALLVSGQVAQEGGADLVLGPEALAAIERTGLEPDYRSFSTVIVVPGRPPRPPSSDGGRGRPR